MIVLFYSLDSRTVIVKSRASRAGGLEFKYCYVQILPCVTNGSPPLQRLRK